MKKVRKYRRSTPVGRLRRHAGKIIMHASLIDVRIASWNGVTDKRVIESRSLAGEISKLASRLDSLMCSLEKSDFVPPKKSGALRYEIGQKVAIAAKYVGKYKQVFADVLKRDPKILQDLTVSNMLPSGGVVVCRQGMTPFLVAKSHLCVVRSES